MNTLPWIGVAVGVLNALGLGSILFWYLSQRRRDNAASEVAERTVDSQVDMSSISAVEAHIGLVEAAFNLERASKDRLLSDVMAQLEGVMRERDKLREELVEVRGEVENLRGEIGVLQEQLQSTSDRITNLLEADVRDASGPGA